jgi:hypothetical protein
MDIFGEMTDMRILSVARIHRQLFTFTTNVFLIGQFKKLLNYYYYLVDSDI